MRIFDGIAKRFLQIASGERALVAALFFLAALAAPLSLSAAVDAPSPLRVLIDPGHGGADAGATRGHLREADITLKIAAKLAELLRGDSRFAFALSRDRDKRVSLSERAKLARLWKADVLLSIHVNANEDARASGVEIYFENQLPPDEESIFLAARENGGATDPRDGDSEEVSARGDLASILEDLRRSQSVRSSFELSRVLMDGWPVASAKPTTRAIRQAPFYVVSRGEIPAVLVEVGFITNPEEAVRLSESSQQSRIAQHLLKGLVRFKETVDKDRERTLRSADAI